MSMETIIPYDERDPGRVLIYDNFNREADQAAGGSFTVEQKLRYAEVAERYGVDVIEAGFPSSSAGDFAGVQAVSQLVEAPVVAALALATTRSVQEAAEAITDARFPRIHTFLASSELHMQLMGNTPADMVGAAVEAIKEAREHVGEVEFSPEDASRSSQEFVLDVTGKAVEAGATHIDIADTTGWALPWEWGDFIARVVGTVRAIDPRVVVSTHTHNDLGLAVANSLAAVRAGAQQAHLGIMGMGERAGNASEEQFIAAIHTRPDQFPFHVEHINTHLTAEICRVAREIADVPLMPNQPIVGPNVFAHEAGLHADKVIKDAGSYEIMNPREWGWEGESIQFGAHSGVNQFRVLAREMGYEVPDDFRVIVQHIKDAHSGTRGNLTPHEIEAAFSSAGMQRCMDEQAVV